ncbi:rac GTPase-activating protein 1 isoform X1 [Silurus meridionalis]|nr:rac GTPase-activating protein 1 isoform X1 [Silurus meridionalis]
MDHSIPPVSLCLVSGAVALVPRSPVSVLDFIIFNRPAFVRRVLLATIDESASILSDISYDKTDDSLDWDSSVVRTVRLKKRQKRRSSRNHTDGPPAVAKRSRSTGRTSEKGNESLVAKTTVTVPNNGGLIEAVTTLEAVPYWTRSRRKTAAMVWDTADTDSVQSVDIIKRSGTKAEPSTPQSNGSVRLHEFVSKTVIKPESCVPCGKRIKFGKISLKCRDCRVVSHPECRERCPLPCIPNQAGTPGKTGESGTLADYVSVTSPMIPPLVVHCVNEIEQRGLHETGLYRLSGADRVVKELKEKFLRGKTLPLLSKVDDIHAITGVLKDFLRNLKEPLLTFRLNKNFMEAAELDDDNSTALMYQTISDLPQPNRDTLAFLMLHLQRVAQSHDTKMNVTNLARVFGPTIVGHSIPDPEPMTILQDTKRQPKVVECLLGLPADYWGQFVMVEQTHTDHMIIENTNVYSTPDQKGEEFSGSAGGAVGSVGSVFSGALSVGTDGVGVALSIMQWLSFYIFYISYSSYIPYIFYSSYIPRISNSYASPTSPAFPTATASPTSNTSSTAPTSPVSPTATASPTSPTSSTAPTSPVSPTATASPTSPTSSTAPTSPVSPTATASPTSPTSSTAPTSPAFPTATASPTSSTAPTSPVSPTATASPTSPTSSTAPTSPPFPTATASPTSPTSSTAPTSPVSPTATASPTSPTSSTAPTSPVSPTATASPTSPTSSTAPTSPAFPTATASPTSSTAPTSPVSPTATASPTTPTSHTSPTSTLPASHTSPASPTSPAYSTSPAAPEYHLGTAATASPPAPGYPASPSACASPLATASPTLSLSLVSAAS